MELFENLCNSARIRRRDKGNGKSCEGDQDDKQPLGKIGIVHGIAGVVVEPGDDVRVILRTRAWVFGVDDFGSQGALIENLSEMIDLGRFRRLDVWVWFVHGPVPT